jgi:hypothetical protein
MISFIRRRQRVDFSGAVFPACHFAAHLAQ